MSNDGQRLYVLPEKTVSEVVEEWLSQFTADGAGRFNLKWQVIGLLIAVHGYCESKGLDWGEISLLADQGRDVLLAALAEIPHGG